MISVLISWFPCGENDISSSMGILFYGYNSNDAEFNVSRRRIFDPYRDRAESTGFMAVLAVLTRVFTSL